MQKRALQATIALMWVFLAGFAIIKLFFADWFLAVVENERILQIGEFIGSHPGVRIFSDSILGIIVMHFYLCSCKQVWRLQWQHYLCIIAYAFSSVLIGIKLPGIASIIDVCAVIVSPILLRCNIKQSIFICILHYAGQVALLFIRSEPLYLASSNYAIFLILMLDVYIWLALYYLYANLYKEETLWESLLSRFSVIKQKMSSARNLKK